jgi:hypothetical protein
MAAVQPGGLGSGPWCNKQTNKQDHERNTEVYGIYGWLCCVFSSQSLWLIIFQPLILNQHRSQCPRGLKRGFVASRLLGLQVRIPSGASMSIFPECYLCYQVKVYATSWLLVQRSPIECDVSKCDRKASIVMRPWPTKICYALKHILRISKTSRSQS